MKRRLFSLILALMLLAPLALAAEYTPLDQKLMLQVRNGSGLTGTLTFDASKGAQMSALDPATNTMLSSLLPGSTMDVRFLRALFGANKGREELRLTLQKSGQDAASLTYVADSAVATLASTLLGNTVLAYGKGDATLGGLLGKPGTAWPQLEPLLLVLNSADNDWKKGADAALERYSAKISVWMQSFTRVSTQKDAQGKTNTSTTVVIPANAVKAQAKQLLTDLYQDAEVITLLQQRLSAKEAAAYLDKNMMSAFFTSLDALTLSQDVSIERVFDATGNISSSKISLPMGGYQGIDVLDASYQAIDALNGTTAITLKFLTTEQQPAPVWTLTYTGGSEADSPDASAYKGTLTLQDGSDQATFTVGGAAPSTSRVYDFNLDIQQPPEVYQQSERGMTGRKEYQVTLLVTPKSNDAAGPQSFHLNAVLSGLSDDRAATSVEGTLTWEDLKTEGSYTVSFKGKSAAPWNIPAPDVTNATRPDSLSATQLAAFQQQLSLTLQQSLAGLAARFLVPAQQ
ncbi:MAG: hypothetical protein ACOX58_02500 [Christensenellales bacterium]|jgi:hypothetical protein